MPIDGEIWRGRRVLITGHTGFKGSWLSLLLQRMQASVSGLARAAPSSPSLYGLARVGEGMAGELAVDVRDAAAVRAALASARPEVVIHLAAQPMVRRSLADPVGTYEVNVMGTVNVLDAVRRVDGVRAVVLVTTARAFADGQPLDDGDPYSSSKACAELVASAYRRSFFAAPEGPTVAVATARAGNVIGGGDWGEDRLLPDAVRAATGLAQGPLLLRNPDAVRPWQHVLNPLSGYLLLAQELLSARDAAAAWDFGPADDDARSVRWVIERLSELWDAAPSWERDGRVNPPEAPRLELDSDRARRLLGWRPVWNLERGLTELVRWHVAHVEGRDMRAVSFDQLERFLEDAAAQPAVPKGAASFRSSPQGGAVPQTDIC